MCQTVDVFFIKVTTPNGPRKITLIKSPTPGSKGSNLIPIAEGICEESTWKAEPHVNPEIIEGEKNETKPPRRQRPNAAYREEMQPCGLVKQLNCMFTLISYNRKFINIPLHQNRAPSTRNRSSISTNFKKHHKISLQCNCSKIRKMYSRRYRELMLKVSEGKCVSHDLNNHELIVVYSFHKMCRKSQRIFTRATEK